RRSSSFLGTDRIFCIAFLNFSDGFCSVAIGMTAQYHRLCRLPRPCRLWRKAITTLTDELGIHQSFSCKARNRFQESPFVILLAFVESKSLLIQVSEQMKRLDVHIRSLQRALEKRPKVLKAINMHMPLSVGNRVINDLVNVLIRQSVVGAKFVRDNLRTFFHIGANCRVNIR